MTGPFLLYIAAGRLIIWTGQRFITENKFDKFLGGFIGRLFDCDFCLGVWVYTILALLFHIRILEDTFPHVLLLSELLTGCAVSFTMHLLSLGWKARFDVLVIE